MPIKFCHDGQGKGRSARLVVAMYDDDDDDAITEAWCHTLWDA
jgi:hypothetical protein